jgi:hypothetical protein
MARRIAASPHRRIAASPGAPALAAAVEQRVRGSWDESFS